MYITKCRAPNSAPEGRTEKLQLTSIPQNVGNIYSIQIYVYVRKCTFRNRYPIPKYEFNRHVFFKSNRNICIVNMKKKTYIVGIYPAKN